MGILPELRGQADLGFYLKILQAYEALKTGHTQIKWTFDPARGSNARLNFGKLGSKCDKFTLDKYGHVHTELYGDVPTDRFTVSWDLTSEQVHTKISEVASGTSQPYSLTQAKQLTVANIENLSAIKLTKPFQLAFPIPADIDELMITDPQVAITWRKKMRTVLSVLMTTEQATNSNASVPDPALFEVNKTLGDYLIVDFATGLIGNQRESYYILQKK